MRRLLLLLPVLLLPACTAVTDDDDSTAPVEEGPTLRTLVGEATWNVDFDADAEAAGLTDCSYTRHYSGQEDLSAPWICGDCDLLVRAQVTSLDGQDCYDLVSATPWASEEWIGFSGTDFRRGGNVQGTASLDGDQLTWANHPNAIGAPAGGTLQFDVTGTFTLGEAPGDPRGDALPPEEYACGWEKGDAAPYEGDYSLMVGQQLPGGLFQDVCGDWVELRDLLGRYLVVDISAMDCGPCRQMAAEEPAFLEAMAADGIEVEAATLLAPSLGDTAGTPTQAQLQEWIDLGDLESPVLADRGWGVGVVEPAIPDDYGYPTTLVVAPDGTILDIIVGFAGWGLFGDVIRADAQ